MNTEKQHGGGVIFFSFIVALMLTAMPLPEWAINWRPAWVAMVLIYWCMALPHRVGIGVGWLLGIFLDVLQGTLLGQNAIGLAILAFLTLKSHQRVRMYPLVQQALVICLFVVVYQLLSLWVRGIMGIPPRSWTYWMPAFTSMVLWPWLFIILRDLRRRYHVS
ncbi:MAG: rod shape-determining protein MreD [Gammaproteobacteria bacterium RIFCSPLOWO2_02_FULL_47_50]|jgi:rod shape-determining protein MreD|uniref:Rod shape-determining protein MreD n=2 Tax=environmental samples TaxID=50423 RepID=A0A0H4TCQ8_9GAMM|nr:rod shape-determining protein MreD, rod shape-determining protein MreD [uncultured gamma proteobacterium Rifle_16ft_4_minimus_39789]AKQ05796.1 rod shape-determining protein MreD, rod shape-determining protein MreD [uncultured gamma proteobacterium Rifle_16ft_4_minimus_38164]OGT65819.1 MAG: rod shape-determining protein MreD [Gammaproteobacteria bacterium RIFCSPLOWO2_01_FULL_47_190]OGT76739.1 MAG: rod shape-determining protein MreD [Gammaproteobacteria bacterium RIFCSPLOWO2_12_47_11]OGT78233.